jgi:DNA-binding MarR family transcriptional regulator
MEFYMIYRHERGILKSYLTSSSTQAKHQAKLYSLLDWIYRFGFTSTSVIEALWGVERSVVNRLIRRYVRDEIISEVATFACRDRRLFLLKPKGIRLLEELHGEKLKYNQKPSTLNFKTITHDLMCAAIVASGIHEGKYKFFITEKEQVIEGFGKNRRFDALVFENDTAELVGIE